MGEKGHKKNMISQIGNIGLVYFELIVTKII